MLSSTRIDRRISHLKGEAWGMEPQGREVVYDVIARLQRGIMPLCAKCSRPCVQAHALHVERFWCGDFRAKD